MVGRLTLVGGILLVALVVLTPAAPAVLSAPNESAVFPAAQLQPQKIITIAQQTPKEGFGPWFIGGPPGPLQWEELHSNFLVTADAAGNLEPGLVEQLPSLGDGTIEVLLDGRMRTVWKMRPNVRWHDGRPFTIADVEFGWQVITHPEIATSVSPSVRTIESIEAVDEMTMAMIHSTTYFRILQLGYRDLFPLPRHILGEAFNGSKEAFIALPYFSTQFIHTGPFRLREFRPGDQMIFERFDDYYLGQPRLDRVIVRFIADNNSVVSNLLAGSVDLAGELPVDVAILLRDQWQSSGGGGYMLSRQAFWRFTSIQFNPEWGGPPELQRDVRARAGLAQALDIDSLRAVVFPGLPDTEGDTFMLSDDPKLAVVGRPFARYKYDQAQALRTLAEAGWRRASDGRMLNSAGRQVHLDLRVPTSDLETDLAVVAGYWRDIGFDVGEELTPAALRRDNEYNVKFPGLEITGQGPDFWQRFDSRLTPTPQNRFTGNNAGYYVNTEFNRLVDSLQSTLDDNEAAVLMRDMGRIMADDLPALPHYFAIRAVTGLSHARGVDDIYGAPGRIGTTAKKAHLWDRI